jgi:hypothetical protein
VRKALSESALGLLIKTVGLGEGIGIGTGSRAMESITKTMLRRSGPMPIHTLGNDDTTEKEKEKENMNQHEDEDDEPNTYRASSFARLNHAARDTPLSSWIHTPISLRIAATRTHRKLPRSQLHPVHLRLRLYLRL